MWITDMAVAAMLLPLGVGLLRDAGLRPGESNFGRSLMIATAFGPLIGGIATPAGTAANIVAIAQLKQLAGVDVSFWRWMLLGTPASLLMIPFAWWILRWLFPPEIDRLPISGEAIRDRMRELGPLRAGESRTLLVFAVSSHFGCEPLLEQWSGGRIALPVEAVGLAGGVALFCRHPRAYVEAGRGAVDWGGLMMIVAASRSASPCSRAEPRSGSRGSCSVRSRRCRMRSPFVIVLAVAGLHLLFSSNTVTASIIIPILVALATDLRLVHGQRSRRGVTSSLAFVLVSEGRRRSFRMAPATSRSGHAKAGIWMRSPPRPAWRRPSTSRGWRWL